MNQEAMKRQLWVGMFLFIVPALPMRVSGQAPNLQESRDTATEKLEANRFEVATVKPAAVDASGSRHISLNIYPNGRLKITNFSLKNLIGTAYNLNYWQISGGAGLEKDLYDIEALAPQPQDQSPEYSTQHDSWLLGDPRLRGMLQALLADRFKLRVHDSTKPGWVYTLEKGDKPISLVSAAHPRLGGFGSVGVPYGGGNVLLNASMAELAAYLSNYVYQSPVVDKTVLSGVYDFRSKTTLSDDDVRSGGAALIVPLLGEMGLKLSRTKGQVVTLVVDSFAQPSEN